MRRGGRGGKRSETCIRVDTGSYGRRGVVEVVFSRKGMRRGVSDIYDFLWIFPSEPCETKVSDTSFTAVSTLGLFYIRKNGRAEVDDSQNREDG